jgi:hypothetical protein
MGSLTMVGMGESVVSAIDNFKPLRVFHILIDEGGMG